MKFAMVIFKLLVLFRQINTIQRGGGTISWLTRRPIGFKSRQLTNTRYFPFSILFFHINPQIFNISSRCSLPNNMKKFGSPFSYEDMYQVTFEMIYGQTFSVRIQYRNFN